MQIIQFITQVLGLHIHIVFRNNLHATVFLIL